MKSETFDFIAKTISSPAAVKCLVDFAGVVEVWSNIQHKRDFDLAAVDKAFSTALFCVPTNPYTMQYASAYMAMIYEVMSVSSKSVNIGVEYDAVGEFLMKAVPACAVTIAGTPLTDYPNVAQKTKDHLRSING